MINQKSKLLGFLKSLDKKYEITHKSKISEEMKNLAVASKSENVPPSKGDESAQISQQEDKIVSKLKTITDLPVELHSKIIRDWDYYDFETLAIIFFLFLSLDL